LVILCKNRGSTMKIQVQAGKQMEKDSPGKAGPSQSSGAGLFF